MGIRYRGIICLLALVIVEWVTSREHPSGGGFVVTWRWRLLSWTRATSEPYDLKTRRMCIRLGLYPSLWHSFLILVLNSIFCLASFFGIAYGSVSVDDGLIFSLFVLLVTFCVRSRFPDSGGFLFSMSAPLSWGIPVFRPGFPRPTQIFLHLCARLGSPASMPCCSRNCEWIITYVCSIWSTNAPVIN